MKSTETILNQALKRLRKMTPEEAMSKEKALEKIVSDSLPTRKPKFIIDLQGLFPEATDSK